MSYCYIKLTNHSKSANRRDALHVIMEAQHLNDDKVVKMINYHIAIEVNILSKGQYEWLPTLNDVRQTTTTPLLTELLVIVRYLWS